MQPLQQQQKSRGMTMTLSRKNQKALGGGGGGTWGSISRVFARQKKRAPLDASLYDGKHMETMGTIICKVQAFHLLQKAVT